MQVTTVMALYVTKLTVNFIYHSVTPYFELPRATYVLVRAAASFKRPLLSVDVSVYVCLCVGNFAAIILETKRFMGSCPVGTCRIVPTARRLVTSSMTSLNYDVIIVTSQYSKWSHAETRTRIRVDPLSARYGKTLC